MTLGESTMVETEHEWSEDYERAIRQFESHIHRADDGTFVLEAKDGPSIGIYNPVIYADLVRSLNHTNNLVKNKQLNPKDILSRTSVS
jgi:hypothetical protein